MLLIDILLVLGLKVDGDVTTRDTTLVNFLAFVYSYVVFFEIFRLGHGKLVLLLILALIYIGVNLNRFSNLH